jgi:hypothetical protein
MVKQINETKVLLKTKEGKMVLFDVVLDDNRNVCLILTHLHNRVDLDCTTLFDLKTGEQLMNRKSLLKGLVYNLTNTWIKESEAK